jgi:hypothetical protein
MFEGVLAVIGLLNLLSVVFKLLNVFVKMILLFLKVVLISLVRLRPVYIIFICYITLIFCLLLHLFLGTLHA